MKVKDIIDYLITVRDDTEAKKFSNQEILEIVGVLQFFAFEFMFKMNAKEPPAVTYEQWRNDNERA